MKADPGLAKARGLNELGAQAATAGRPAPARRWQRAALRALEASPPSPAVSSLRGHILLSLAHTEVTIGAVAEGLRLMDEAEQSLPATERGFAHGQRGLILMRTGKIRQALDELNLAITAFARYGPSRDHGSALLNRSLVWFALNNLGPARKDLVLCRNIADEQGDRLLAAKAQHNLGYLDWLDGRLAESLVSYAEAEAGYLETEPTCLPGLALDRSRALLSAGLFQEASQELTGAIGALGRQRLTQDLAEAQLTQASAALLAGQLTEARAWAARARISFNRRDNSAWAALASLVELRAALVDGDPRLVLRRGRSVATKLTEVGLAEDGAVAALLLARALLQTGRTSEAAAIFASIRRGRPRDQLETQLLRRLTRSELAAHTRGPAAERQELRAGLDLLHDHRSQLGCLDFRTGAAVHGVEIANAAVGAALRGGNVAELLTCSELARAQALRLSPVRPPADAALAELLNDLRQARQSLADAEVARRPTTDLRERCAVLNRQVQRRFWTVDGKGALSSSVADVRQLSEALGEAALVSYVHHRGRLFALCVVQGTVTLTELEDYAAIEAAAQALHTDLDALASMPPTSRLGIAVQAACQARQAELSAQLVEPLQSWIAGRALVLIPSGVLHHVAWGLLPALAGVPVTVSPSATAWLKARQRWASASAAGEVFVLGPGLEHAEREVADLAATYPGAVQLVGASASADRTLQALNGVRLGHLAAHGHHERENALFSSLLLADGPLLGYDVQLLAQPPEHVILAACRLGQAALRPGNEPTGFATALLAAGTRSVIASPVRVSDQQTAELMRMLHQGLQNGLAPAAALATAIEKVGPTAFVCLGDGL